MSHESSNTVLAFLLGVVTGGVTALLMAPASGPETRRKLSEGAKRLRDEASKVAHQAGDSMAGQVDRVKDFASSQKSAIQEAVNAGKQTYQQEVHKEEGSES